MRLNYSIIFDFHRNDKETLFLFYYEKNISNLNSNKISKYYFNYGFRRILWQKFYFCAIQILFYFFSIIYLYFIQ